MRYLVTGAAGFIGFHLSQALAQRGDLVVGLDNLNPYYDPQLKKDRLRSLLSDPNFTFIEGDITDHRLLNDLIRHYQLEKVCHLAAQAGVRYAQIDPFAYQKANLAGFLSILEACRSNNIQNLVYASSSSVYGADSKIPFNPNDRADRPLSLYAATKRANELMAHSYHHLYGLKCTGLRFFTVYGPWGRPDMSYYSFSEAIRKGQTIEVYNYGYSKRDFTYIDDIVAGVISAVDINLDFAILNLGNSHPIEVNYLIELIEQGLGRKAERKLLPARPEDPAETYANIEDSRIRLGFDPKTPIEQGMPKFLEWYRNYVPGRV